MLPGVPRVPPRVCSELVQALAASNVHVRRACPGRCSRAFCERAACVQRRGLRHHGRRIPQQADARPRPLSLGQRVADAHVGHRRQFATRSARTARARCRRAPGRPELTANGRRRRHVGLRGPRPHPPAHASVDARTNLSARRVRLRRPPSGHPCHGGHRLPRIRPRLRDHPLALVFSPTCSPSPLVFSGGGCRVQGTG